MMLRIKPTADMFANRRNKKFRRFVSLVQDNQAIAQDCLSIPKGQELPYLHPPIPLIQPTINKVIRERITAVLVVPYWPAQPWWPSVNRIMKIFVIVGESAYVLKIGGRMKKRRKHLPPGRMMIAVIEGREENHYSDGLYNKEDQIMKQFKQLQTVGIAHEGDIDCDQGSFRSSGKYRIRQKKTFWQCKILKQQQATSYHFLSNKATNANQIACRTAVGMLFRAIGQEEQKINGFALKQIMKKPSIAVAKELREEPIWGSNKLLNYVKKKALNIKSQSEQELMGIVISVIMGYSTLRLTEIHRASDEEREGGTWQLHSQIIKVQGYKATLTFRRLADLNMCPTFWLQQWFQ
ncbi:MAG: hypothetical protein EZS28_021091 [Streblomastix strix]|uniref:Uncharacterized protein n=1 Tax=Streblomastix strix TaxID=222440 RepID=A0A5J4VLS7_9EUKA|nr:MAG: hypothetical protein EZS28_021091 [Streblomastix strix]